MKTLADMTMREIEEWCRQNFKGNESLSLSFSHYKRGGTFVVEPLLWDGEKWHDINPQGTLEAAMSQISPPKTFIKEEAK